MRRVLTAAVMAAGVCVAATACQASTESADPAPINALTVPKAPSTAVPVAMAPVELSGSGVSVLTADLEPGGYTVQYTNTSSHMIVKPVNREGTKGSSFINAMGETSGVTTYASTGPVTLQIENTKGPWTLRFVPLR